MHLSLGVLCRAVALVGAVLIAVFSPANSLVWLSLDVGLLALGTLVP